MGKITKRAVDALKPNRVGTKVWRNFLWNRELRDFGIRISPTSLKVYLMQYRNPAGKSRRLSLGCEFRRIAATDSDASRTVIPIDPGQP